MSVALPLIQIPMFVFFQFISIIFITKLYVKCIMAYSALINHKILFHCYHFFAIRSAESHNEMKYELSLVML
jgi:hypothetical protein